MNVKKTTPKMVRQYYLAPPELPYLELRATFCSTQAYKAHRHNSFSIGAMLAGSTQLTLPNRTEIISTNELVFIEPDCVHSCNPIQNQARSYYMLYLNHDWLQNWLQTKANQSYKKPITNITISSNKIIDKSLFKQYKLLVNLLKIQDLTQAKTALAVFLEHFFHYYCPVKQQQTHVLTQTIKNIFGQNLETPLLLNELAAQFQICPETLIRLFKKQTGISPKAYRNNLRIEEAKQRLKQGETISKVCYQLGFSDQSHFQKTFAHYTASTPRQYQLNRSIFDNN